MNKAVFSARSLIFFFWFSAIVLFLYSPKIISSLTESYKELNVITFTGIILPETIKEFYEKTGIQVNITNFESNEELLAKLRISGGKGYDILVASDYTVDLLRKDKLVKKIDHKQISNFQFLDSRVLNKYYDPENEYSLPISWAVYGIGYNKEFFGDLGQFGWERVFKHPKTFGRDYKICMQDDPREAIYFAELFLFGNDGDVTEGKLKQIRNLLLEQKKWVDIYSSNRQEYFLVSGTVPLAVLPSEYMVRVFRESDNFGFVIPKDGSLMSIENVMISASSKKTIFAYQFIDFLFNKEVVARSCNKFGYYPVNKEATSMLDDKLFRHFFDLIEEKFKKIGILKIRMPRRKIEDLWLAIKAS